MEKVTIYHNARCSKSREALQYLQSQNLEIEVKEYLKEIPTATELKRLLQQLNIKAEQLIRVSESIYKERFKNKQFTEEEWVDLMIEFPQLIERPIVLKNHKAVIGRPIENVMELVK